MPEDQARLQEIDQNSEWSNLAPGSALAIDLTPEGRPEIMGGEVVAKLRLGEPANEVHVVSVHTPNMDFEKLLRWNRIDTRLPGGTVIIALNEAGDPSQGIAASALLMPGNEYDLGGKGGTLKWFRYPSISDPAELWTPFDTNPSLQEGVVKLDLGAHHLVVESSASHTPVQISRAGLYPS